MSAAHIVIVDRRDSPHGQLMERCAAIGRWTPRIEWIRPTLDLVEHLARVDRRCCAVAIPGTVVGANELDAFTRRLQAVLTALAAQGVPVFAAVGYRHRSYLATHTAGVTPTDHLGGRARLKLGRPLAGSSGASVRAAALVAFLHRREGRVRTGPFTQPNTGSTE